MQAMLTTRPDLNVAVLKRLKMNLHYIKGIVNFGLRYKKGGEETLLCYVDTDYANKDDRKSMSGFFIESI